MITLAIDTSTARGSVALLDGDRLIVEEIFERDGIFDAIGKLKPGNFDLILVGVGPGSFTGIRAGLAAAKGLALPRAVPIRAVSSFDALALTALPEMPTEYRRMCVHADARRGEIYFALYDRTGKSIIPCRIGTRESVTGELRESTWWVSAPPVYPRAALLAQVAPVELPLEPIYLRETEYRKISDH